MKRLPRVYAILDLETCQSRGLDPIVLSRLWCDCGVRLIQLRAKGFSTAATFKFCQRVAIGLAGYPDLKLVVNDRIDICLALGLQGVHLPSNSFPISTARTLLGRSLIGRSCHADVDVKTANAEGADFVTLSPIFSPNSKPEDTRSVLGLQALRSLHTIPVFALGGLNATRSSEAIDNGAYGVAILGSLARTQLDPALINFVQSLPA